MDKRIYRFSKNECDGDATMKALLGGKGANLAEMAKLGMPVPPGFTITTKVCAAFQMVSKEPAHSAKAWHNTLMAEVASQDAWLMEELGHYPLVSVRSGAVVSMPGMMDTILNVGLCVDNIAVWSKRIGERAAWDSYRRLIQMLGATAYEIAPAKFEFQLARVRKEAGVKEDWQLSVVQLQILAQRYMMVFEENVGKSFPQSRQEQLRAAILAVFGSWANPRAVEYRKINKISHDLGTAVNIQAMVFGNAGEDSGTGVLFSRNPSTGFNAPMGEFLQNAQGEDVVAGIRTPRPLVEMAKLWPQLHLQLMQLTDTLEQHYRDMMDIEFTVQNGVLYLLQCRTGKRSALAAFKIAAQMVGEKLLPLAELPKRLTAAQFKLVRRPRIAEGFKVPPHAVGKGASTGVAVGKAVFSAKDAIDCTEPCILVTKETCPDDIAGMAKAVGILTQTGGATSHAAVVARAMDKPCVVGCTDMMDDGAAWSFAGGPAFDTSTKITIDGDTGGVWVGTDVPVVDGANDPDVHQVCLWLAVEPGRAIQMSEPDWHDCTGLNIRVMAADWWGDTGKLVAVLSAINDSGRVAQTTLDFTPPVMFSQVSDTVLAAACGVDSVKTEFLTAARDELLNCGCLVGLTLVWPSSDINELKAHGYKVAVHSATVADLLNGDAVTISPKFVEQIIGGQAALDELRGLLLKAGKPLSLVQAAFPLEYLVFAALAGSG